MKTNILVSIVLCCAISLFYACDSTEPEVNNDKQITSFICSNINPPVIAAIDETGKQITAVLPGDADLTNLVPIITCSNGAIVTPLSGTAQNFTNPVIYTVTAGDGSMAQYTVTLKKDIQTETLSGSMYANRTLPDLGLPVDYIIDDMLYLEENALLTIEPGVKILFTGVNGGIDVGENAGLKMVGTAEKPIVFSGPLNNPNKGSWNSIRYHSKRADNLMEYVQLLNGGEESNRGVLQVSGSASVKNCMIDGSLGMGVEVDVDGILKTFEGNTIQNCDYFAMWYYDLPTSIMPNNSFKNNVNNLIRISGYVDTYDLTLKALEIPYYVEHYLSVEKMLTLEPGVSLYFQQGVALNVMESGKIVANGTSEKHIKIRGLNDESGYWGGIFMLSKLSGNKLIYCDISGGGASDSWNENSNIYLGQYAKITIQNSTFSNSNFYGITIEDKTSANFQLIHSANSFAYNRLGNVYYEYEDETSERLP